MCPPPPPPWHGYRTATVTSTPSSVREQCGEMTVATTPSFPELHMYSDELHGWSVWPPP